MLRLITTLQFLSSSFPPLVRDLVVRQSYLVPNSREIQDSIAWPLWHFSLVYMILFVSKLSSSSSHSLISGTRHSFNQAIYFNAFGHASIHQKPSLPPPITGKMPLISTTLLLVATALTASALPAISASHIEPRAPASTVVNPAAVFGTVCNDPSVALNSHDTNVAILSICGGIAGTIEFCGGNPTSTVGASGTSELTLTPVTAGATLNVSKGRWEGCMRAAQATCPTGTFTSTCVGGTSDGAGFQFVLSANSATKRAVSTTSSAPASTPVST